MLRPLIPWWGSGQMVRRLLQCCWHSCILHGIKNTAKQSPKGLQGWKSFVLAEVQECISSDMEAKPRSYFSTNKISLSFLDTKEMQAHDAQIQSEMPILYGLLYPQLFNATSTKGFFNTGGSRFDIWEDMECNVKNLNDTSHENLTPLGDEPDLSEETIDDGTGQAKYPMEVGADVEEAY
ncbi:hypothetical protein DFH28DRAFT_1109583 [Melampsora americana]|nr:hypothetical protein DFH28DRAFT_1109583 [Melampsora americana]